MHWVLATTDDMKQIQLFDLDESDNLPVDAQIPLEEYGLDEPWTVRKVFEGEVAKQLDALRAFDEAFGGFLTIDLLNTLISEAVEAIQVI